MTTGLAATGAVQGGEEVVLDGWSRAKAEAALTAVVSQPAAPPGPKPEPSAPWCVNEWGPDLNMTQRSHGQFPMDLGAFQKELGVPLQLYAPYMKIRITRPAEILLEDTDGLLRPPPPPPPLEGEPTSDLSVRQPASLAFC